MIKIDRTEGTITYGDCILLAHFVCKPSDSNSKVLVLAANAVRVVENKKKGRRNFEK